jgi:serine/threonine protein kinase
VLVSAGVNETGDRDTIISAKPKTPTEPLSADAQTDPFYDASRDLPDVGARFEILDRLGEGGMGEVFKARDLELDEVVALKILTAQFGEDPSRLDRLKQEVRLARKISSNGVCRIHDLVEFPNGTRGIAMEYIQGKTLGQLIKEGLAVDYQRIAKWAADVSEGLAAAHALLIIHRDLKPDNIMITPDDRAKILDFGVARHHQNIEQDQRLTQEGMILGTVPYMAPEQLSNAPLDARSDLYSLGLILAEIITGDIPAYGDSYHDTLRRRVIEPEIYQLKDHDPAAPEEFAAAVDHLLRTNIDERPFGAKMVADHLRLFSGSAGLGLEAFPPERLSSMPPPAFSPATKPATAPSSKPINVFALLGVALLCVGLAVAVAQMTKKTKSETRPPPTAKKIVVPAPNAPRPVSPEKRQDKTEPPKKVEKIKDAPAGTKKRRKKRAADFIPAAEEL